MLLAYGLNHVSFHPSIIVFMDAYTRLMDNISFNPQLEVELTEDTAIELLQKVVAKFEMKELSEATRKPLDKCFEGGKTRVYFAYIGRFPKLHVALDNKAGTNRLHTITTEDELKSIN